MQFELELNQNLTGKLLIAMPNIQDKFFKKSLIYVVDHCSLAGAIGVMVNQELLDKHYFDIFEVDEMFDKIGVDHTLNNQFKDQYSRWGDLTFCVGGPVEKHNGFVLYHKEEESKIVLNASNTITNEKAALIEPILVAKGYCLWDSLQLEREVYYNKWLVLESYSLSDLLHNVTPEMRYKHALKLLGLPNLANFDFLGAGNA